MTAANETVHAPADIAAAEVSLTIMAPGAEHRPIYEFVISEGCHDLPGAGRLAGQMSTLVDIAESIEAQWAAAHPAEGGAS